MTLRDEIIDILKNNYDNGEVFTDLILSKSSYDFNRIITMIDISKIELRYSIDRSRIYLYYDNKFQQVFDDIKELKMYLDEYFTQEFKGCYNV